MEAFSSKKQESMLQRSDPNSISSFDVQWLLIKLFSSAVNNTSILVVNFIILLISSHISKFWDEQYKIICIFIFLERKWNDPCNQRANWSTQILTRPMTFLVSLSEKLLCIYYSISPTPFFHLLNTKMKKNANYKKITKRNGENDQKRFYLFSAFTSFHDLPSLFYCTLFLFVVSLITL